MQSPVAKSDDDAFPNKLSVLAGAAAHQPTETPVPCTPPRPKLKRRPSQPQSAKLKCRYCTRMFSSPSGVRYHVAAEHTKEYPHRCGFEGCGRKFIKQSDLDVHVRYHKQDRPYRCRVGVCVKRFVTTRDRLSHEATHSNARPHVCTKCPKAFKTVSGLNEHMKVHDEHRKYTCVWPGCDKSFKFCSSLRVHSQTHSGQKPWKCDDCNQSFTLKGNMKYHQQNSCVNRRCDTPATLRLTFSTH